MVVDLKGSNVRFGSTILFGPHFGDPGIDTYAGTLVLEVPPDASGTFTVGFRSGALETFLLDSAHEPIGLAALVPAQIIVSAPEEIPTLSAWGMVGMSLLLLTAGTLVYTHRARQMN